MICSLQSILSFCLFSLVTVSASRRTAPPRGTIRPRDVTRPILLASSSSSSSSSSERAGGLTRRELQEARRLLEPFYSTVNDSLKLKGEHLLTLLAKAGTLTLAEADILVFEEACHQALTRRLAVTREELIGIYKQEGTELKSQREATRAFKDQLTQNTLTQVAKEVNEERKRKREEREEEKSGRKRFRSGK
ncbi:hypothetical protein PSACC_01802 [Paramicrosporidium saccamoebae]|uniref:Uncharacterized protein n=1 Tax=Paramicrosporidium saccamoebae TaxID=1246581 RepID=A0A2H9TKW1_9FUNG|nr:hypothetical protein PSACC_01802 [Paramicrosporidium saccamoebae]